MVTVIGGNAQPSEAVKDEAADWVAKLRAGDCTLHDERAFRTWLTADPTHAVAFEAMHATWEIAAALPRDPARFGYRPPRRMARREFVWTAGAIALAGGAFATWQGAAAEIYETRVGEQKHITLPDGSLMFLDTETRVSFRMHDGLRLMLLSSGRVNLRVAPDSRRPFRAEVREQSITTNQSRFDMLDYGHMTSIVLIDGQASVEINRAGDDRKLSLQAGERLRVSKAGVSRDRPNLSPLLAWQRGQVVFENSTLEQAASELNRYSDTKLATADPVVASWRVSGVFPVGDNFAFVKAVSKFLPLGMTQTADRILMIQDKSRTKLG
jgi:transmembrane sensor